MTRISRCIAAAYWPNGGVHGSTGDRTEARISAPLPGQGDGRMPSSRMKKAVGFRNIVIHNYDAIDWHIVSKGFYIHVEVQGQHDAEFP
jgi:hypothetical protein